jgi:hypothetical protein
MMTDKFIVFGKSGQYIVTAESFIRAIQAVIAQTNTVALDWNCHALKGYPEKYQAKILGDFRTIIL